MDLPRLGFIAALTLCAFIATPVLARPYEDTKKRFSLELEPSWQLAPLPGDTSGMVFKRGKPGETPASLRVMVRGQKPGETTKQVLDDVEAGFRNEIGYTPGGDVPSTVGAEPAVRRSFSAYANGDRDNVRAIEIYAFFSFGHAHILHFETLEKKRGQFLRDLDRMLASYRPLAGKGTYVPLVGTWINTGGGPDLVLNEDASFKMGPLSGGYAADKGTLTLHIAQGGESYRYLLDANTLTLTSPNIGGDLVFRRSGAARKVSDDKTAPLVTGPLTREQLIGRWHVLDEASSEPIVLQLAPTGSVAFGPLSGRWRYATGRLTITSTANVTITYSASLTEGKLVLGGGDLDRELILERE